MTTVDAITAPQQATAASHWRAPLVHLAGIWLFLLILFNRDVQDIVQIWWNSSTFNHCLMIGPIIGWLVWQRRTELAQLQPRTSTAGLIVVTLGMLAWVVGEAASIGLARHAGLVVMLQGCVVALLGLTVARGLLFPLFYAFFLVPFGEEFVPPLQTLTAEMATSMLGLVGLPAHLEGVFITTPSGFFEVAEACSGVKFLIAMVALGVLAANLCFKTWPRRLGFIAVCLVVPIIANGIRAFGTIWIADRNGIAFAVNFDHVVYGWIFFAVVILLVFAISRSFFDRDIDDPAFDPVRLNAGHSSSPSRLSPIWMSALIGLLVIAPVMRLAATNGTVQSADLPNLVLPEVSGWQRSQQPMAFPWAARFEGADTTIRGRYEVPGHAIVDVTIAFYAYQREGHELIGYGQGGLAPGTDWSWVEDSRAAPSAHVYRIAAPGPVERTVFRYNLVGDLITGSDSRAKLEALSVRLLGGDPRAVGVIVSAEGHGARSAIEAFLERAGGVDTLVDRTTNLAD